MSGEMMNGGSTASIVNQAVGPSTPCVRCEKPLGMEYHVGWDPKGPICSTCWNFEAAESDYQEQLQWQRDRQALREEFGE